MMKNLPAVLFVFLAVLSPLLCASLFADDFTTTDGKKFEGVTVTRIAPDFHGVVIRFGACGKLGRVE